ncbi:hypothetical protein LTR02_011445 [Friedmanniomyces endolithicus]|nr:hypothetical protein LTR94_014951 [Friedmanniomyces endolithicus]KAK0784327.1 hypothetical protein LTR59_011449 [Friedmanniomyces endolithicus]KAK0784505.1 hypothetical protein LTR38_012642 [Friedmanniomyces endolithicus]KAK0839462.1 hypothetical protein LTR03_011259 [Friedmanniomyces endolithicus]KAK0896053.1 hypothetical protein LTR02_011445 [Friedmanniomyces endolithicus]
MPCFTGLAVSIHTPDGPLSDISVQKQSRASRISSYIPVPPAKVPADSLSGKPEQSTFAISITLLTPGLNVPYSTPKSTTEDPYPRPRVVSGLPGYTGERGKYAGTIHPYTPRTSNPNETIAAYIYFDGRTKEEVATLLRRGEETWVNSRWVSIPESEGGGLAEREFIFREVGLERWLNGLDLEGSKDKAERIERRQRRLEKKRRKKRDQMASDEDEKPGDVKRNGNGMLHFAGDNGTHTDEVQDESGLFSSDSDDDDEPPQPEAAGQIKVALFRVLASGEIKRGEYSPQFDVHEDEEGTDQNGTANGDGDVDHTTSFAKPKTLDPKSISTQTVTGLDPPESPYAVFTFFYRGEKQLQKMGMSAGQEEQQTPASSKRKSSAADFANLGPLKAGGTVGFSGYRDSTAKRKDKGKDADAMDSDAEEEDHERLQDGEQDVEVKDENGRLLSPEDARRQGELAEGVQKIKLKRQHSAEPLGEAAPIRKSPHIKSEESPRAGTPQSVNSTSANAGTPPEGMSPGHVGEPLSDIIGSPFKRHRSSMAGLGSGIFGPIGSNTNDSFPAAEAVDSLLEKQKSGEEDQHHAVPTPEVKLEAKIDSDEEL